MPQEFEAYVTCNGLEHCFLRAGRDTCNAKRRVAFSCERCGFYPRCGPQRMAENAALLVDEVIPEQPVRQLVLSVHYVLRFLFASRPEIMGAVLRIVYRVIATHLAKQAPAMLKRLQQAVIDNQNVFAVLMDAVRVCSLGQITQALFEVGGQYRRSM